jgi:site-specific DNA-cytosine methylase
MSDVRAAAGTRAFTVASFFAGGGGSSIGYSLAGGRVIFANEFDPAAATMYRANFPDTLVDERDIRAITETPGAVEEMLAALGLKPGQLHILDGSFPCNQFSTVGPGVSQLGGSATLLFNFVKVVGHWQPEVVIGENVPAFAGEKKRPILDAGMDALRFAPGSGDRLYFANYAVLSASDFGVPQRRRRLFLVAIRVDVAEGIGICSDDEVLSVFPVPTHAPISVRSALGGLQPMHGDIYPYTRSMLTTAMGRVARQLPLDPARPIFPRSVGLPRGRWFSMVRAAWDAPSPTLTALGSGPNGVSGVLHPALQRKFVVPEQMRLHGLPDDFRFTGTVADASTRMGNMVAPLQMKALAESVFERVLRPYRDKAR